MSARFNAFMMVILFMMLALGLVGVPAFGLGTKLHVPALRAVGAVLIAGFSVTAFAGLVGCLIAMWRGMLEAIREARSAK